MPVCVGIIPQKQCVGMPVSALKRPASSPGRKVPDAKLAPGRAKDAQMTGTSAAACRETGLSAGSERAAVLDLLPLSGGCHHDMMALMK